MYRFDHGWGWGLGLAQGLLWLGFLVLVVTAVVLLVRSLARPQPDRPESPEAYSRMPERLLAERYARGEIDDEEYRHRLDTLRSRR